MDSSVDWEEKKDAEKRARYAPVLDFFNSLSENLGWKLMQFNFTVGVRGSISNVDRTVVCVRGVVECGVAEARGRGD